MSADIKSASKIELTEFANAVSKWMDRNSVATRMAGTVWSRIMDLRENTEGALSEDTGVRLQGLPAQGIIGPDFRSGGGRLQVGFGHLREHEV